MTSTSHFSGTDPLSNLGLLIGNLDSTLDTYKPARKTTNRPLQDIVLRLVSPLTMVNERVRQLVDAIQVETDPGRMAALAAALVSLWMKPRKPKSQIF